MEENTLSVLKIAPGQHPQQSCHEKAEKSTCFKKGETDKKVQHSTPQSMQMQVSFCPSAIRVVL